MAIPLLRINGTELMSANSAPIRKELLSDRWDLREVKTFQRLICSYPVLKRRHDQRKTHHVADVRVFSANVAFFVVSRLVLSSTAFLHYYQNVTEEEVVLTKSMISRA